MLSKPAPKSTPPPFFSEKTSEVHNDCAYSSLSNQTPLHSPQVYAILATKPISIFIIICIFMAVIVMTRLIISLGQLVLACLLLPLAVAGPVHMLNGDCDYTPTNDKGELGCCIVLGSRVSYCTWTPAGVRTGVKGPADLDYWMTTSMLLNPPFCFIFIEKVLLTVDVQWRLSECGNGKRGLDGRGEAWALVLRQHTRGCSSEGD